MGMESRLTSIHKAFDGLTFLLLLFFWGAGVLIQWGGTKLQIRDELIQAGEFQAASLNSWVAERKADANVLKQLHLVAELAYSSGKEQVRNKAQPLSSSTALQTWLNFYRTAYRYRSIFIIDQEASVLFSTDNSYVDTSLLGAVASLIAQNGRNDSSDAWIELLVLPDGIHLATLVQIPGKPAAPHFLLLVSDTPNLIQHTLATSQRDPASLSAYFMQRQGQHWLGISVDESRFQTLETKIDWLARSTSVSLAEVSGLPEATLGVIATSPNLDWSILMVMDQHRAFWRKVNSTLWVHGIALLILSAFLLIRWHLRQRQALLEVSRQESLERERTLFQITQQRMTDIFGTSPDWLWEVDSEGRLLYVSPGVESVLGIEPQKAIGQTLFHFTPEVEREQIMQDFLLLQRQAQPLNNYESTFVHHDGSLRHTVSNSIPILDEQGRITGYRGTTHDITNRKAAQERLRILNVAVEQSMNCILLANAQGVIEYANPAFCETTGFDLSEVIGQAVGFNGTEHTTYATRQTLRRALEEGKRWKGQFVNRRRDGALQYFFALISPIRPAGDVVTHYLCVMEDTTERVQHGLELDRYRHELEHLLAERTQLLAAVRADADHTGRLFDEALASVSQGFAVFDQSDCLLVCNQALKAVYPELVDILVEGSSYTQMLQALVEKGVIALHGKSADTWLDEQLQHHADANGLGVEWQLVDGRWLKISDFRTRSGFIVSNHQDISVDKAAELMMVEARDLADTANRAKSLFLANMSHEIRTPMNAIIGLSHLCLQTDLSGKQRDYVTKVNRAATVLLGIINDILDFSKIEAGKLSLEVTTFSLQEIVSNVSNLFLSSAEERGLEMEIVLSEELPDHLIGDPLRLGQVLTNLLSNALKFTKQGCVSLEISPTWVNASNTEIRFAVTDSGIGMSEEQLRRLFQVFEQADSSITRQFGGTGLGLTISQQLVCLMGGDIRVSSKPGEGSCFEFFLPFKLAPIPASPIARRAPSILVVDDDKMVRTLAYRMLEKFGCRPLTVASGQEALAVLEDSRDGFELILLDWRMPDLDGQETAKRIRQLPRYTNTPLIMLTGASMQELNELDGEIFSHYLFKPIQYSLLYDAIHDALGERSGAQKKQNGYLELTDKRVLLVEDNEFNQQVAAEMLEAQGITVDIVDNGQVAIERMERLRYDLVLMDMQMPVMDGVTATRVLRAHARFDQIPIIAMTANALPAERQQCLDAGMNDFMSKPIDPKLLLDTLVTWLGQGGAVKSGEVLDQSLLQQSAIIFSNIDLEKALFYAQGKSSVLIKMLGVFAKSVPKLLHKFDLSVQEGACKDAARHVHSLKGMAATLGMTKLTHSASGLESRLKAGESIDACQLDIEALRECLNALLTELPEVQAYLATHST